MSSDYSHRNLNRFAWSLGVHMHVWCERFWFESFCIYICRPSICRLPTLQIGHRFFLYADFINNNRSYRNRLIGNIHNTFNFWYTHQITQLVSTISGSLQTHALYTYAYNTAHTHTDTHTQSLAIITNIQTQSLFLLSFI